MIRMITFFSSFFCCWIRDLRLKKINIWDKHLGSAKLLSSTVFHFHLYQEKESKVKKAFTPMKKKATKGVMDGVPLTQEGVCQVGKMVSATATAFKGRCLLVSKVGFCQDQGRVSARFKGGFLSGFKGNPERMLSGDEKVGHFIAGLDSTWPEECPQGRQTLEGVSSKYA
jgi:hypothetical protein